MLSTAIILLRSVSVHLETAARSVRRYCPLLLAVSARQSKRMPSDANLEAAPDKFVHLLPQERRRPVFHSIRHLQAGREAGREAGGRAGRGGAGKGRACRHQGRQASSRQNTPEATLQHIPMLGSGRHSLRQQPGQRLNQQSTHAQTQRTTVAGLSIETTLRRSIGVAMITESHGTALMEASRSAICTRRQAGVAGVAG